MAINKVLLGSNVLIDITDTTATASDVAMGKNFYTNDGVKRTGTKSDASPINVNPNTASVVDETLIIVGGGGGSGGTEVTITSAQTNANSCANTIIPSPQVGHVYIGCLKNKSVSNFVANQFIAFVAYCYRTGYSQNFTGNCLRYRNNDFATAVIGPAYDAVVEVGDVFVYYDFDFRN